jgi:hypothetical protein
VVAGSTMMMYGRWGACRRGSRDEDEGIGAAGRFGAESPRCTAGGAGARRLAELLVSGAGAGAGSTARPANSESTGQTAGQTERRVVGVGKLLVESEKLPS